MCQKYQQLVILEFGSCTEGERVIQKKRELAVEEIKVDGRATVGGSSQEVHLRLQILAAGLSYRTMVPMMKLVT